MEMPLCYRKPQRSFIYSLLQSFLSINRSLYSIVTMLTKAFLVAFISFLNVGDVLGKTLVPIRPGGNRNGKRQEQSGLDLVSTETFRWGDEGSSISLSWFGKAILIEV